MNWISVIEKYPDHGQLVKIKTCDYDGNACEVEAVFNDCEEYLSWEISKEQLECRNITGRPTHWMPIMAR